MYIGTFSDKIEDKSCHHLPDVHTMDGVLNLLSLATVNFLGNVLDFRSYSAPNQGEDEDASEEQKKLLREYDHCDITGDERATMCYARGIAIITFDWIHKYCTITGPNNHTINDLPSIYVCRLLKALLHYKSSAMEKQLAGAPHCDTITLRKQIENAVQCDKHLSLLWDKEKDDALEDSLIFQSDGYSVTWSACSA